MIRTGYRLAVLKASQGGGVVVERGEKLLPLADVLEGTGAELPGPLTDLMPLLQDWGRWNSVIEQAVEAAEARFARDGRPAAEASFAAPLAAPGKIICIGSNFHDHIAEMAIPVVPTYPYSFLKPANNTVRATGDAVSVPHRAKMMDWEVELGVVIGSMVADVPEDRALDAVAGYMNFNDLSARDWLASRPAIGVDWVQHKAFDGFAPMGPYLLPSQFVPDPQDLAMRLSVNGELKQDSTTGQMVFGVAAIIAHLTSIMTLFPGDVIATGTPAGVGHGAKPPQYLQPGDEVRIEIEGLGELVTPIV
jgi:2-keto-4-pentenoate hydratase/2-oxohepta-3-ene-1,7-dioic acid hydratase in catechol pathway